MYLFIDISPTYSTDGVINISFLKSRTTPIFTILSVQLLPALQLTQLYDMYNHLRSYPSA